MQLTFFSRTGWQDWDVAAEPALPDRMPVLVDDDLLFEDAGVLRASVVVNRWLQELPISGAPSPGTWAVYARTLRSWLMFLACLGVAVFDTRDRLKRALGAYAAHRAGGPVQARFAASTWNQHISRAVVVLPVGGSRRARRCGAVHLRPGPVPLSATRSARCGRTWLGGGPRSRM